MYSENKSFHGSGGLSIELSPISALKRPRASRILIWMSETSRELALLRDATLTRFGQAMQHRLAPRRGL
jgi:hypothetical protein